MLKILKTLNFSLFRSQWPVLLLLNLVFIPTTLFAAPPVASFKADKYSGLVPLPVVLDCGDSSPWDGPDKITRIEWTGIGILIKNRISIAVRLSTSGTQEITLTLWNAAGEKTSTKRTFNVLSGTTNTGSQAGTNTGSQAGTTTNTGSQDGSQNDSQKPTAAFTATADGLKVDLDASASQSSIFGESIDQYDYKYARQPLAGAEINDYSSDGAIGSITLPNAGTYTFYLYVTDKNGRSDPEQQKVTVEPRSVVTPSPDVTSSLPIPGFFVSRTDGRTVYLDASASRAGSNASRITEYQYKWQSDTNFSGSEVKYTPKDSITFNRDGRYTITLNVKDNLGNNSVNPAVKTANVSSSVTDPPPTTTNPSTNIPSLTDSLIATPTSGKAPLSVSFDASGYSASGEISYKWSRSDDVDITSVNSKASTTFEKSGTYTITLDLTDNQGKIQAQKTISVLPSVESPSTETLSDSFIATPTSGPAPLKVDLNASGYSASAAINYEWSRDDHGIITPEEGNNSKASTTFNEIGTYTITLDLTDSQGEIKAQPPQKTITVLPDYSNSEPPTASFTVTPSDFVPATVFLDASSSVAGEGRTIDSYKWESANDNLEGATAFMTFTQGGLHKIKLEVTDDFGAAGTMEYYITIPKLQKVPVPRFTITTLDYDSLSLDASSSFDPDGGQIEEHKWTHRGGGELSSLTPSEKVNFTISRIGTFFMTLTVEDDDRENASASATASFTVSGNNDQRTLTTYPVANFQTSDIENTGKVLSTLEMDISSAFHPNGEILGYEWFLGETNTCETRASEQDALYVDDKDPLIHKIRLTKLGNYHLCFKVTDSQLSSDVKGKTISIIGYGDDAHSFQQGVRGGVLIKDEFLPNGSTFHRQTFVDIVAEITPLPKFLNDFSHAKKTLNVYVAVAYKAIGVKETPQVFFMKDGQKNNFRIWNVKDISQLKPAYEEVSFDKAEIYISIFNGQFLHFPGKYEFYVAYDWSDKVPITIDNIDSIVVAGPISFTVVP